MKKAEENRLLPYDFEDSVGYWICRASRAFERAMNDELAPRGITYRQAQVLWLLVHEGSLSQTDLAERMRIEPPTLVGILDRMEREGWIRRESDDQDRRRKFISPLPKAKPVWSKIIACSDRVRARGNEGLSREEQQLLKQLMGRILDNLSDEKSADPKPPQADAIDVSSDAVVVAN
jgi:MarR family transcriptional regulator, transcriptional regulator for hemolysin